MVVLRDSLIDQLCEESLNSQAGHVCLLANKVEQAIELWLEAQDYEALVSLYHHPGSLPLPANLHASIQQDVLLQADLKGNQLK